MPITAPDLTKQPPRSARVRLGGYVILPRMLDKGRAEIAGTNGEYHYACPMDMRLMQFLGIDPAALKAELATGKGDGEILAWILCHRKNQHADSEVADWTTFQERRVPTDPESREFFNSIHSRIAPQREDIATWFDLLDLDDHVSYGGKP